MASINQHPDYHEGFFDAVDMEPLFEGERSPEYEAGWRAWWEIKDLVNEPWFLESLERQRLPDHFERNAH